ncbi:E3 binding domain-containing protein [Labrys wisconsinensis]|uniref:Pyruvate dehydrogenase E2 component (Dihydrolipoamide acetyltransferase) n=1 Tax=Labrys wisconsinensis TaxID=425677 RepID=A0ABU0JI59_9HYPH|nr:E3 binding domain-containing protein [Labrys wisconsinensis]MDQ0473973.1 pyruvate dehydrogenase E2 component (dihydrolipoamide acetyltransferase) [Labrys wisconsinensis]
MSGFAVPAARIAVSPYARRLARERGLTLAGRRGSGPGGRIVAADLDGFARPAVASPAVERRPPPVAAPPPVAVPRPVAGFAVTLDLAPAAALLGDMAGVAPGITADDLILKAIGRAAVAVALPAETILWRDGSGGAGAVITGVPGLTLSAIAARRAAAAAPDASPAIPVSRIRESGLRPTAAALAAGLALRLVVAGEGPALDALLVFDEDMLSEERAARFLAELRAGLAHPLRLVV